MTLWHQTAQASIQHKRFCPRVNTENRVSDYHDSGRNFPKAPYLVTYKKVCIWIKEIKLSKNTHIQYMYCCQGLSQARDRSLFYGAQGSNVTYTMMPYFVISYSFKHQFSENRCLFSTYCVIFVGHNIQLPVSCLQ